MTGQSNHPRAMGLQFLFAEFAEIRSRFDESDVVFDGGAGRFVARVEKSLEEKTAGTGAGDDDAGCGGVGGVWAAHCEMVVSWQLNCEDNEDSWLRFMTLCRSVRGIVQYGTSHNSLEGAR